MERCASGRVRSGWCRTASSACTASCVRDSDGLLKREWNGLLVGEAQAQRRCVGLWRSGDVVVMKLRSIENDDLCVKYVLMEKFIELHT